MKRKISVLMAFILVMSTIFGMNVFAASYPTISSSNYIEFKAQQSINVYKNTSCKTRGTSSPSKKYNASIAKNDICYIYKIASSYIQINYPTNSGRRTGYIKRADLFNKTSPDEYISSAKASVTVYKANGNSYIAKGDKVWRVSPKTGYSGYNAVIYDAKSGKRAYKMGYITQNDLEKIKKETVVNNSKKENIVSNVKKENIVNNNEDNTDYSYVSKSEIENAIKELGVGENSNAHKALKSINSVYAGKLSANDKKGTCIFLFEGVGSSNSVNKRMNAVCVVVKNGKIKYVNKNCTTIPDRPFSPKNNRNAATMPTLISGIYNFNSHDHGDNQYAALKILSANVLRFKANKTYFEEKNVGTINIHRRSKDDLAPLGDTWANSAGCMNVGKAGINKNSEYSAFVKAVGIVDSSWYGNQSYKYYITGKAIVDRSYADDYLSAIGYPKNAITKLK